jgi:hypothetical protein
MDLCKFSMCQYYSPSVVFLNKKNLIKKVASFCTSCYFINKFLFSHSTDWIKCMSWSTEEWVKCKKAWKIIGRFYNINGWSCHSLTYIRVLVTFDARLFLTSIRVWWTQTNVEWNNIYLRLNEFKWTVSHTA